MKHLVWADYSSWLNEDGSDMVIARVSVGCGVRMSWGLVGWRLGGMWRYRGDMVNFIGFTYLILILVFRGWFFYL